MSVSTQGPSTSVTLPEAISRTAPNGDDAHSEYLCRSRCLHVKLAALLAVLISFALYLAVNAFFLITLRLLAAYFTLLVGAVFYALFMLGYRQHNRWMIFAYFFFLGIFLAVLVVTFSFSLAFLRDPEHAPLVHIHEQFRFGSYYNTSDFYEKNPNVLNHDIVLYKVMFALSSASLLITSLCIPVVYRFFKYLCDHHIQLTTPHSEHRSQCNCDTRSRIHHHRAVHSCRRHRTDEGGSICAISYPPPCPPAYEVKPTVHAPLRRPHIKTNSPRAMLILPQYTDFRPEVYAEPPPYEEKPSVSGDE